MISKTYRELSKLKTFEERFAYLDLKGKVGESTFGYDRYLNQMLYKCDEWKEARDKVIIRDNGNDLGIEEYPIHDKVIIHHMIPITIEDVEERRSHVFDPEYLVTTSHNTHNALHFGNIKGAQHEPVVRRTINDTTPWK